MPARRRRQTAAPALLIDGMGTLVTLRSPVEELRRRLAADVGVEVSAAEARTALGAEIAYYRAHMQDGRDDASLAALRRRCGRELRDALPPRLDLAGLDPDAVTAALLGALRFAAFPDVRPALVAARRRGARIVVVSNWDVSLSGVLELAGLAPLLDAVITSAAVGARKPDPEIFRHALAVAGVDAGGAVHVGDSVEEDIVGAGGCGIEAVLLRRAAGAPGVPVRVDDDGVPVPAGVPVIAALTDLEALWPTFRATADDLAR